MSTSARTTEIAEFCRSIDAPLERWRYIAKTMTVSQPGGLGVRFVSKGCEAVARIVGLSMTPASIRSRLRIIARHGVEGAHEWFERFGNGLTAGPLPAWCVGHTYLLNVKTHPDVFKVGFSRRVDERIADLRAQTGAELQLQGCFVGTLLDEYRAHHDLAAGRISGEWFLHPDAVDRSVPEFLKAAEKVAA